MRNLSSSLVIFAVSLAISGCTIRKDGNGDSKNIEIKAPFFGIKVNNDSKPEETGLKLYPGARQVDGNDHDHHNAHVSIDSDRFGLKVVALTFESDDPPQKIMTFYREDLKRYGKVLECPRGIKDSRSEDGRELACSDSGQEEPGKMDLAVGFPSRQRVVAIKPHGSGTEFNLVYVQLKRGETL